MTAKECILGRRSIRAFKADPIDHDIIAQIVETASYAPSWKHTQITRYTVVEGALKDEIAEKATTAWPNNGAIIKSAPALVVVSMITGRSGYERDGSFTTKKESGWQMFDAGIASQTFCLAAYEMGIGSLIEGIFDPDVVAELIDLPEGQEVVTLIPIGYPNEEPACPKRKAVADLVVFK